MSYLLDALRKADHERQLGSVPDLATEVQIPETSSRTTRLVLACVVVGVVVLNLVVLGAVMWRWLGSPGDNKPVVSEPAVPRDSRQTGAPTRGPMPDRNGNAGAAADSRKPAPQTGARVADAPPVAGQAASVGSHATDSRPEQRPGSKDLAESPLQTKPDSRRQSPRAGVTAAQASAAKRYDEVPLLRELPPTVREELPEYTFNGLLYSSVPGVSFVLINGGRYHEGERIPGAGAVVFIDGDGVVINYQGRRFRLSAPHG